MKIFVTDNDGVIFDRMPIYRTAFKKLVSEYGADSNIAAKYFYESAGESIDNQFSEIFKRTGVVVSDEEILNVIVPNFFRLADVTETPIFPKAAETLVEIKKRNYHIFVTSGSNTDDLERLWKTHSLPYDMILGSDEIKKGDRHIELFAEYTGQSLGNFCQGTYFIGDGKSDMALAKRNRLQAIGITNTVTADKLFEGGADHVISHIEEILDFLP